MIPVHYMRCDCAVWPLVIGNDYGPCHRCDVRPHTPATAEEYEEDRKQWNG